MKKIITIGGGHAKNIHHIDDEIVRLSGKKKPKFLFIPTASSDDERYMPYMHKRFVESRGCRMESMLLLREKYSKKQLGKMISEADIIYVGGGNTLMMMRKWRSLGIDRMLKKAWQKGTVLCGLSAGSICWFESGHSDSMWYYDKKNWDYIRVRCLGFLPFIHCPHYDSKTGNKKRKNDFKRMMKKYPGQIGIVCDDEVAIEWLDDKFKVLSAKKTKGAYKVYWKKGRFYEEKLENTNQLLPIKSLST